MSSEGKKFLLSRQFMLAAVLLLGTFQIFGYRVSGIAASTNGSMPTPQPDTLLYCQAARRIVEGHPFSYSEGEPVSTGTTSVLYPFALAVPYAAGATGARLLTAGFWLNAFFYLVFLWGWATAFARWTRDGAARLVAGILLALAGQPAFAAMAQSDTGMMMAVGAVVAAGLALGRPLVWGLALVVAPWVRPEGMMLAAAIAGVAVVKAVVARVRRTRGVRPAVWVWAAAGVVSTLGVFALNYALTGSCQFSSVATKGYFTQLPLALAVSRTLSDLVDLVRSYGLVGGVSAPREFALLPLLGGAAFVCGLLVQPRAEERRRLGAALPLALAGGLSLATVASSGWQGTNFDRYLAWLRPLFLFFTAIGCVAASRRFGAWARAGLPVVFVVFAGCGAVSAAGLYFACASASDRQRAFADELGRALPPGASVGSVGCHLAYGAGARRFYSFSGIYSPAFLRPGRADSAALVEILRNEPALRPDYLVMEDPDIAFGFTREEVAKLGPSVLAGPDGYELRKADWSAFDAAAVAPAVAGRALVARVDVGYEADERAADYELVDRWGRGRNRPFVCFGTYRGRDAVDTGRVVAGGALMTVPLRPGRAATVVMRVLRRADAAFDDGTSRMATTFALDGEFAFNLEVDGARHGRVTCAVPAGGDKEFADVTFEIPASAVVAERSRVAILGDHIVCGIWFFQ